MTWRKDSLLLPSACWPISPGSTLPAFPFLHSLEGDIPRSKQVLRLVFCPEACLAVTVAGDGKRLALFDFP